MTSRPPPPRQAWLLLAGALSLEISVIYQGARSSFQTELKGKKSCWKKFTPVSCKPLAPQVVQDDSWGSRLALGWQHIPQHAQGYGTCLPPQPCSQRQNICMEHWRRTVLGKSFFYTTSPVSLSCPKSVTELQFLPWQGGTGMMLPQRQRETGILTHNHKNPLVGQGKSAPLCWKTTNMGLDTGEGKNKYEEKHYKYLSKLLCSGLRFRGEKNK